MSQIRVTCRKRKDKEKNDLFMGVLDRKRGKSRKEKRFVFSFSGRVPRNNRLQILNILAGNIRKFQSKNKQIEYSALVSKSMGFGTPSKSIYV